MIVSCNEDFQKNKFIGNKAKRLQEMKALGFKVPDFVVLPANSLCGLIDGTGKIKEVSLSEISQEITGKFNVNSFAVRSSALIEDGNNRSYAGQFKTVLDVKKSGLAKALDVVLSQAYDYLNKDLGKFSIIIQEYIEADYAGVCFTRNPSGGREMVIEYSQGRGEELVSGENKPENLKFFWNSLPEIKIFQNKQNTQDTIGQLQKIEEVFAFPQDIEWCLVDKTFYFLQSRPITTILKSDYEGIKFLDGYLQQADYHFEKTEISEIMPRPCDFSFGMLEKLYSDGGAIKRAYQKLGILYQPQGLFQIIGNELYIDREIEKLTLFPLKSKKFLSGSNSLKGLWQSFRMTFRNILATNKLSLGDWQVYHTRLVNRLNEASVADTTEEQLVVFRKDYQLVFTINILCSKAMSTAKARLSKNSNLSIASFAKCSSENLQKVNGSLSSIDTTNFFGNSFDIMDESLFVKIESMDGVSQELLEDVADSYELESTDQKQIELALLYLRLRELGRCLVVRRNSELRQILFNLAQEYDFNDKRLIYFASLNEILEGDINQEKCSARRTKYLQFNKFSLPVVLSSEINTDKQGLLKGISAGIAQGRLLRIEELEENEGPKPILYTELLTPDLLKHFDRIAAIVSANGGELSHLAILAREAQIPVVSGFSLGKIKIGEMLEIDGTLGIVSRL